ncbi:MAG: DUF4838 domain-containing protein [Clostridia bacterium]|nr:DUF4838 domain-containing protein [Clostridia bacterium]
MFKKRIICLILALAMIILSACTAADDTAAESQTEKVMTETETDIETETEAGTEETEMKWEGAHVKKLTVNGIDISEYKVVCENSDVNIVLKRAKNDLISYIRTATGITLEEAGDGAKSEHEICIGVTDRDTEKIKEERQKLINNGYLICFDDGRLYITGNTVTGTLYGVYSFLEDNVGCRFYSSTYETVKFAKSIDIPADTFKAFSPKLIYRDPYWFDTFTPAFAAKLKINGAVNRTMNGYGSSYTYAGPFVHSLPSLAGTDRTPNVQPCLTDPAVYEKVLGNVRKYLKENPSAKIVSVSQNDSYPDGLGCQCENCKKIDEEEGTPMGSLLTFVNRIANDIKDDYPNVLVDTLAYRYTRKAPKNIKPADNVIIRLCSIECCFSHPLDSDCEANKAFTADIEEWSKICKNLFVWDYTTDFLYYVNPFPNLDVLYDNVRYFTSHNVIGLFEQGNYQSISGEFGELRAYLLAKLLWDPDMSREEYYSYMDDFLQGYYGDGWEYIREYIDKICKNAANNDIGIYSDINTVLGIKNMKTKERVSYINELEALWDKALELSDEEHFANVEKSSLQIRYASLLIKWTASSPKKLEELHKLMQKYNITHFREGVKTPEAPDYSKSLSTW